MDKSSHEIEKEIQDLEEQLKARRGAKSKAFWKEVNEVADAIFAFVRERYGVTIPKKYKDPEYDAYFSTTLYRGAQDIGKRVVKERGGDQ